MAMLVETLTRGHRKYVSLDDLIQMLLTEGLDNGPEACIVVKDLVASLQKLKTDDN